VTCRNRTRPSKAGITLAVGDGDKPQGLPNAEVGESGD
jgi:hypothetical protein